MIENEMERCERDIVYFAEKYLGYELRDWQREVLKRYQNGDSLHLSFINKRSDKMMVLNSMKKYGELFR